MLMLRDEFRNVVFKRDGYVCVFCDALAKDAHHIIERRLWSDGGYYIDNGISVCEEHHLKCESTEISVEEARHAAKITNIILPSQFYDDDIIDKWGNYILPNGQRFAGELFNDESVQKVIKPYLSKFTKYVKHPRTFHLPWSLGRSSDDKIIETLEYLEGREIVVTEKMDGENTTLYNDYYHARSLDSANHPSRNRLKAIWAGLCGEIPDGYRLVVENVYAQHSIKYDDLLSYMYGLFVVDNTNKFLNYNETIEWFDLLGIVYPRVFYRGIFDEEVLKRILFDRDKTEGYVVRVADAFQYSKFRYNVAKYVRTNHLQTKDWDCMKTIPNKLKDSL